MKPGKLRRIATNIARLLENPKFIFLRNKKVNLEIYEALDTPWIHELGIATVLDIGANTGHFALAINALLPHAKVYSFEPLPECFNALQIKTLNTPNIEVFNLALGNSSGSLAFRRNANSLSSSFLEMTDIHKSAFPETSQSEITHVMIERLDNIAKNIEIKKPLFVKIDVQGFEDQVLLGGMQIIKQAHIIVIETSFFELYEKQPLFDKIHLMLKENNYIYAGALQSLTDPNTGQVLQEDSIFINTKIVP
jgi:FkbM family methyltransferase